MPTRYQQWQQNTPIWHLALTWLFDWNVFLLEEKEKAIKVHDNLSPSQILWSRIHPEFADVFYPIFRWRNWWSQELIKWPLGLPVTCIQVVVEEKCGSAGLDGCHSIYIYFFLNLKETNTSPSVHAWPTKNCHSLIYMRSTVKRFLDQWIYLRTKSASRHASEISLSHYFFLMTYFLMSYKQYLISARLTVYRIL